MGCAWFTLAIRQPTIGLLRESRLESSTLLLADAGSDVQALNGVRDRKQASLTWDRRASFGERELNIALCIKSDVPGSRLTSSTLEQCSGLSMSVYYTVHSNCEAGAGMFKVRAHTTILGYNVVEQPCASRSLDPFPSNAFQA